MHSTWKELYAIRFFVESLSFERTGSIVENG